jgi:N-acetylglucosaminyldiphosphoundecaprenol N-acetyl-beta-D-mannosaminyltransferase
MIMASRMQRTKRRVFGIDIDVASQGEAIDRILSWCARGEKGFVVTPNLDHVLKLRRDADFRAAYEQARMVLPDGRPLIWLGNFGRADNPALSLVTGADLIEPLCAEAARDGFSVFLFGSSHKVLERAAERLRTLNPNLIVAGLYSPPMGFQSSEIEKRRAVKAIAAASPDIVLVALGAPKQELWAAETINQLNARAILCIGAGLDFIAGEVSRAPVLFRRVGAEWLWRALSEPRRLGRRYLSVLVYLPLLFAEHLFENARRAWTVVRE